MSNAVVVSMLVLATLALTCVAASSSQERERALAYLREQSTALGVQPTDLDDLVVTSQATSESSGATHVYVRQRYRGIDIAGAEVHVNIARDGNVFHHAGQFFAGLDRIGVGTYNAKLCIAGGQGGPTEVPVSMTVIYSFGGFSGGSSQTKQAGSLVPVKFTLNGNKGLGIIAAGFPTTQQVSCTDSSPIGASSPASVGPLTYASKTELYQLNWQTSSSWAGTCRQFVVGLNDGTQHALTVKFP